MYQNGAWTKVTNVAARSVATPPSITFNVVCETSETYTLTYNANGGTGAPTDTTAYRAKATATLATSPVPTHGKVSDDPVVFIGWTASQTSKIYAKEETAPTTITSVTFEDSNITVYAAWGYDTNDNGIPDVKEKTYTVTYRDGVIGKEVFKDQVYSGLLPGTKTPSFKGKPTRSGYVFAGWKPTVAKTVTEDVTYVAKWKKVSSDGLDYVPKTGDTTMAMIGGLMLFALCGGTAVYVIDRKKSRG